MKKDCRYLFSLVLYVLHFCPLVLAIYTTVHMSSSFSHTVIICEMLAQICTSIIQGDVRNGVQARQDTSVHDHNFKRPEKLVLRQRFSGHLEKDPTITLPLNVKGAAVRNNAVRLQRLRGYLKSHCRTIYGTVRRILLIRRPPHPSAHTAHNSS